MASVTCVRHGLDVALLRNRDVRMTKDALDRLVVDAQSVQVRGKTALEGVPTVPENRLLMSRLA